MTRLPEDFDPAGDLLKGKTILVTGATGGYGRAISLALAKYGATVVLLARNLRKVEALYDEIEAAGYPTPAIYPMNLEGATGQDYLDLAQNIESQLGGLDGLIHTAAMLGMPTAFAHSDVETWYKVHQVNLHAPYLLTRACLPLLARSPAASVVFMTDDKSGAYWDAYQVSKRGLAAMAELLANEYDGGSLRVNCVNPGKTRTALQMRAFPAATDNDTLPTAEERIAVFIYLMSDASRENGALFE